MVHSTSVTLCPAFGIRITSSINLSFPGEPFPQLINVTKQIGMCNCAGVWIKKKKECLLVAWSTVGVDTQPDLTSWVFRDAMCL